MLGGLTPPRFGNGEDNCQRPRNAHAALHAHDGGFIPTPAAGICLHGYKYLDNTRLNTGERSDSDYPVNTRSPGRPFTA